MKPSKFLIASYHFPPDAAVGGLRAAKFARHLPHFGWQTFVVTARDEYREEGLDYDRLKGLEAVTVIQTRRLPSVTTLLLRLASKLRRSVREAGPPPDGPAPAAAPRRADRETLTGRLKRYGMSLVLMMPDSQKNWALYAAVRSIGLIRSQQIECVLTSGPPFSTHAIGLLASIFTDVTWIADFRDPWVEMIPERRASMRSLLSERLERRMEAMVVARADAVLTTTDRLRQSMIDRYPAVPADKFVYLPNSIDTERFHSATQLTKYERLTITYAGSLYFDRTPEPVFQAVGALLSSGAIRTSDIAIKLLGHCRSIDGVDTRELARRYGVEAVVEVLDPVPYAEAIRIMQRSHLLLAIAPERHWLVVGAKLFDYLGSGSSILGLAEEGATSDLIAETGSGRSFSSADVNGLRTYLHELILRRDPAALVNDVSRFRKFDVRYLTGRLAAEASSRRTSALGRRDARVV